MPKRPISAYLAFTTANINKIKEKENCTHPEAMKKSGEIWKTMSDKDKKQYNSSHDKDQSRYDKQFTELSKKGFFIMADGSKSTDSQNIKLGKKKRNKEEESGESDDEPKKKK